jgi:cation transport protein ChaC
MAAKGEDIWVFGYGSLMWRPDFPHVDIQPALLRGYHRALCVYSTRYRGTPERPGLVLGLDRGGSCRGRALRVAGGEVEGVMTYLYQREMINKVYIPKWLPVVLPGGTAPAYVFVADCRHRQYAGKLSPERAAELILGGHGPRGSGVEYLENTIAHMDELGIPDGPLHHVLDLVRAAKGA